MNEMVCDLPRTQTLWFAYLAKKIFNKKKVFTLVKLESMSTRALQNLFQTPEKR
jgi:hypothetical protein